MGVGNITLSNVKSSLTLVLENGRKARESGSLVEVRSEWVINRPLLNRHFDTPHK